MSDDELATVLVVAVATIYAPMIYFMSRFLGGNVSLVAFARALFKIGKELSDQDNWVPEAIERLEAIYNQSPLRRSFASVREVVDRLHYLAYVQGGVFLSFRLAYRHEPNRSVFLAVRAELEARDQPYSTLRGDARTLVQAVNANLDPNDDGGKLALKRLANYMKDVEGQVVRQRRLNILFGVVSVVGTVVAIVALVLQISSIAPLLP